MDGMQKTCIILKDNRREEVIRGSHIYTYIYCFFYFVPFVWIVIITYLVVNTAIAGILSA